ncbi:MAG TPA: ABC transporter substrate-binding protein [Thermoanaerobaculia bacterium]|nr:ABC transporter substrate-binding protein [Thermoanaerobaculia bacterium]
MLSPRLPRLLALALLAALLARPGLALDRVTFATNWKAEAEHGGFYQALATGIYKRYGLDVTLRMGGPQVNNPQLLAAGLVDFNVGSSSFSALNYVKSKVPMATVAALFQKDPQVLLSHPGQGNDTLESLKGKPILIAPLARSTFWNFLRIRYGYTDDQIRTYTFNMAPFLADKKTIQEGYLTSEPFTLQKAGVKPVVHVLADHGFDSYSTTIECAWKLVETRPDLVQRFVDASIEGWYSYLYGNPAPANARIKRDNPEMTDDLLAYSIAAMKKYGVVDSGDALTLGIGAMTDARWKSFTASMIQAGVYPPSIDLSRAYTLRFVNKKVGLQWKTSHGGPAQPRH